MYSTLILLLIAERFHSSPENIADITRAAESVAAG